MRMSTTIIYLIKLRSYCTTYKPVSLNLTNEYGILLILKLNKVQKNWRLRAWWKWFVLYWKLIENLSLNAKKNRPEYLIRYYAICKEDYAGIIYKLIIDTTISKMHWKDFSLILRWMKFKHMNHF
jgi:hypothetical protein